MARLSRDEIRRIVIDCVSEIAPEADFDALKPERPWREQLEIDSFDFQNLLAAIETRAGVTVPEMDYAKLALFDEMLDYLEARQAA